LASTVRDNVFDTILTKGIYYNIIDAQDTVVKMSVFERNVFNNCKMYAVQDDLNVKNQLFLDNTGTNSNEGTAMSLSYNHIPVLKNNNFTGYAVEFQNGPTTQRAPEKLLNLPIGLVFTDQSLLSGQSHTVPVWNLGSSSMQWSASSANAWIILADNIDNTVEAQGLGAFSFSIDPDLRPANETIATISVVSGSQTQRVAVIYATDLGLPGAESSIVFPRENTSAEHKILIYVMDSIEPRQFDVESGATNFVITSSMMREDFSHIIILEKSGTNWNPILDSSTGGNPYEYNE